MLTHTHIVTHTANIAANNWPWQAIFPVKKENLSSSALFCPLRKSVKAQYNRETEELGFKWGREATKAKRKETASDSDGQAEKKGYSLGCCVEFWEMGKELGLVFKFQSLSSFHGKSKSKK